MKKAVFLLTFVFVLGLVGCGSAKDTTKNTKETYESNKIELPPNVASNKYSEQRKKN